MKLNYITKYMTLFRGLMRQQLSRVGPESRAFSSVLCWVSSAPLCLLWIPRFGLAAFAILYSIGNICSMGSIMFLAGPCRQIRSMCAPERAIAVSVMMVCLALTLCAAFWWKNNGLALLFCILQALAFTWYGLSYVPFIRDGIIKLCTFCL
ncbi:vesicle transport protein SFT2B-like isoform X4 [Synchiropus splendidus]|uniref:vesicle transport protein SFT2B-like isoform X4 n=1 Tax=Synchiropus splendidus TaxID=270530 RepID=UPI00237DDA46|nr:vesicle transport protein SFT2B-like isoform X4 [Synchiropus splendidus]